MFRVFTFEQANYQSLMDTFPESSQGSSTFESLTTHHIQQVCWPRTCFSFADTGGCSFRHLTACLCVDPVFPGAIFTCFQLFVYLVFLRNRPETGKNDCKKQSERRKFSTVLR